MSLTHAAAVPAGAGALFRRIVLSAVGAGCITGLVVGVIDWLAVAPLIERAAHDTHAATLHVPDHDHDHHNTLGTVTAMVLTAIGYAFLLVACFSRFEPVGWRRGLAWGCAGFAVFQLAPGLVLSPALPGTALADLASRQLWWLIAVLSAAAGLACLWRAYARLQPSWLAIGALVIALPHGLGALQPLAPSPEPELGAFTVAAFTTAALFWLMLGSLAGYFYDRLR